MLLRYRFDGTESKLLSLKIIDLVLIFSLRIYNRCVLCYSQRCSLKTKQIWKKYFSIEYEIYIFGNLTNMKNNQVFRYKHIYIYIRQHDF